MLNKIYLGDKSLSLRVMSNSIDKVSNFTVFFQLFKNWKNTIEKKLNRSCRLNLTKFVHVCIYAFKFITF